VTSAIVYWIEADEDEIHFIDGVVSAYDGMANVRRDYILRDGRQYFKVFVSPGMEDEFLELLTRLKACAAIRDTFRGDRDDAAPAAG
jgi:hypothetical protein